MLHCALKRTFFYPYLHIEVQRKDASPLYDEIVVEYRAQYQDDIEKLVLPERFELIHDRRLTRQSCHLDPYNTQNPSHPKCHNF